MSGVSAKISLILVGHTNEEKKKQTAELLIILLQQNFRLPKLNISKKN